MLKKIIIWLRRLFITFLSLMIIIYSIGYLYEKPDIGQGHYVQIYDSDGNSFYSSNKPVFGS